jgi:hypothetical protein
MSKPIRLAIAATLLLLAACGSPQQAAPAPTLFQLPTTDPSLATNTPLVPATVERSAPTLPPTFTPTEPLTPSATVQTAAGSPTLEGFNTAGTIYYIFNGDSIAALAGDGSKEELIAVGGPYSSLTASPDSLLLAYIAPGSGSAREVYISSRDGVYVQRISCLGMADVRQPVWSPDSKMLAWVAAPAPGAPGDVYVANVAGSGGCPTSNNQRMIAATATTYANSPTWNTTMDKFYFGNDSLFGLDTTTNTQYELAYSSGFGSNHSIIHNPTRNLLAFLRPVRDQDTGAIGGQLISMETDTLSDFPGEEALGNYAAFELEWSKNGRYLLITTADSALVYDADFGTTLPAATGTKFPPSPTFSPNAAMVAYVDADPNNVVVPQVFVVDRGVGDPKQITTHTEGTIIDLVWLEG